MHFYNKDVLGGWWTYVFVLVPSYKMTFYKVVTDKIVSKNTTKQNKISKSVNNTHYTLLLVFSVTPFKIDQNKNQNRSIDKVRNLGNERT